MHTKAVYQAAKALARIGVAVLRFNFRGVGRSAGTFDGGPGEKDDYPRRRSTSWQARYPGLPLWAAGFSFGSWIALDVGAGRSARAGCCSASALPVDRYDFAPVQESDKPKFIIHGERDELDPAQGRPEVLRRAARAEGAGRDRGRRSSVRRTRRRRSARRSRICSRRRMKVQGHERRSHRFRGPHRRRQGAEGHAERHAARRHGGGRHREALARAPGASTRRTSTT